MNSLESLLQQVSYINKMYAKLEESENSSFNIFSILRHESEEVGLHSRFLAELLNPGGSHKCGYKTKRWLQARCDRPHNRQQQLPRNHAFKLIIRFRNGASAALNDHPFVIGNGGIDTG